VADGDGDTRVEVRCHGCPDWRREKPAMSVLAEPYRIKAVETAARAHP
jgi:hypothetical protein